MDSDYQNPAASLLGLTTALQLGKGLQLYAATAAADGQIYISAGSGNRTALSNHGGNELVVGNGFAFASIGGDSIFTVNTSTGAVQLKAGTIATYNGINTAGLGVPAIYAGGAVQHKTNAAPTTVSLTPAGTVGMYRVHGTVYVKTGTTISLKLNLTYKYPDGTSATDGIVFQKAGSTTLLSAIVTTGSYSFDADIMTDATGGAISLVDNAGTYTTCEYYYESAIEQISAT